MHDLQDLMASISDLENITKGRLQKNDAANRERLKMLSQLTQFGVCTCHCHFGTSVFHSAEPCCGNARLKAATT
jgi:hypothetical protein